MSFVNSRFDIHDDKVNLIFNFEMYYLQFICVFYTGVYIRRSKYKLCLVIVFGTMQLNNPNE